MTWQVNDDAVDFTWQEANGPAVAPPVREGLGSALIRSGLPGAHVAHEFEPTGLQCKIRLPVADSEARS